MSLLWHLTNHRWNYKSWHYCTHKCYSLYNEVCSCSTQCTLLNWYEFLYNKLLIKLQSLRCPWCACSCLSSVRHLRLYFCDAADCSGSSWCSVWYGLFNVLSNSWLSAYSKQLVKVWQVRWTEATSLAVAEKCVYALVVRHYGEPAPHGWRVRQSGHYDHSEDGVV